MGETSPFPRPGFEEGCVLQDVNPTSVPRDNWGRQQSQGVSLSARLAPHRQGDHRSQYAQDMPS